MTLTGTISITPNWAQLDLDVGQTANGNPIRGFVVLMKNPLGANATDADRIDAAYDYFREQDGLHYTLFGNLQMTAGVKFLLVKNDVQG